MLLCPLCSCELRRSSTRDLLMSLGIGQTLTLKGSDPARSFDREEPLTPIASSGDTFYFNHGLKWGAISEGRAKQILLTDYAIDKDSAVTVTRGIMKNRSVRVVADIAGCKAGIRLDTKKRPFLVTETTPFVEPVPGGWPLIKRTLTGLLGIEQLVYFH